MFRRTLPLVLLTIGGFAEVAYCQNPVSVTAYFTAPNRQQEAVLFVTVRLLPGHWLYSITQPAGGPNCTAIKVEETSAFAILGAFAPLQPPILEKTDFPNWPAIEKHVGCVSWRAPIRFAPGVDYTRLTMHGAVWAQVDTAEFCIPPTDYPFTATLANPPSSRHSGHPRHWLCRHF